MTIKELSQLYNLNREIELADKEIDKIETALQKMQSAYATTVKGSAPSFPYVQHTISIGGIHVSARNKKEYYQKRAELQDLKRLKELKQEQCFVEYGRLLRYIADVPDSLTRMGLELRFVNGLTWPQTAASMGGGNTEESVKKMCYRYIYGVSHKK